MTQRPPCLIALSGLPGTGKTTLSRLLARRIGVVHLRVDSIEVALKTSSLQIDPAADAGYLAAAAIARDNLALGLHVIADTVNPVAETRALWSDTAAGAGARLLNVELTCGDPAAHRTRVERRQADIPGHDLPSWQQVLDRHYQPWPVPPLSLDTAALPPADCVARIAAALQ